MMKPGTMPSPPEERWFPIQVNNAKLAYERKIRVPWRVAEKAYAAYRELYGDSQSLERIAERGGFGLVEIVMLLGGESSVSGWLYRPGDDP